MVLRCFQHLKDLDICTFPPRPLKNILEERPKAVKDDVFKDGATLRCLACDAQDNGPIPLERLLKAQILHTVDAPVVSWMEENVGNTAKSSKPPKREIPSN